MVNMQTYTLIYCISIAIFQFGHRCSFVLCKLDIQYAHMLENLPNKIAHTWSSVLVINQGVDLGFQKYGKIHNMTTGMSLHTISHVQHRYYQYSHLTIVTTMPYGSYCTINHFFRSVKITGHQKISPSYDIKAWLHNAQDTSNSISLTSHVYHLDHIEPKISNHSHGLVRLFVMDGHVCSIFFLLPFSFSSLIIYSLMALYLIWPRVITQVAITTIMGGF